MASQAFAQADACQYAVEPRSSATPAATRISLVKMSPPEGGEVRRDTILAVDVDFEIADFKPDSFWLYATFPMNAMGSAGPESMIPQPLDTATGRARLCIPLTDVYENPMVQWPLTMNLTVHKLRDLGSEIVAYTAPIKINSLDIPAGVKERQAAAPPVEYYDSLSSASEFFNRRLVRYKVCIERFPALQPQMTPAYRAWERRHQEQIDLVSRVQFELFKVMAGGDAGRAVEIQDGIRSVTLEANRNTPAAKYRQQCNQALEEFADTEDLSDLAISDELELIRKHDPQPTRNDR